MLSTNITRAALKGSDSKLEGFFNSETFAPPGVHPLRTGKTLTKIQVAAEHKAKKEAKARETEGKKLAAAARRADAKNKKQERLITATKTKAQKAVAKADELRKKLDSPKKAVNVKSLSSLAGGAQSNKKIKGVAGKSTPTSTTTITSFAKSPQRKASSAKTLVNNRSPFRYCSAALLTGGLSKSSSNSVSYSKTGSWDNISGTSNSKAKEETFVLPQHSLGAPTQQRGGRRSALPMGRVPKLTKERVTAYTLGKFDSDLHMGSDSDSEAEDSDSHKDCSSARGSELMSCSACSYTATYQAVSDQFEREEDIIIKGVFPGNYDHALISRFVAHHFAGVWDKYAPFN